MVEKASGRKVISPETKQQAMRELASGATLASVSNKYGISVATLSTWKRGANSAPISENQPQNCIARQWWGDRRKADHAGQTVVRAQPVMVSRTVLLSFLREQRMRPKNSRACKPSVEILLRLAFNARKWRRKRGYTLSKAAVVSGLHPTKISGIENGHLNTTLASLEALARGYKCTEEDLLQPVPFQSSVTRKRQVNMRRLYDHIAVRG
jgi:transposase-like protein